MFLRCESRDVDFVFRRLSRSGLRLGRLGGCRLRLGRFGRGRFRAVVRLLLRQLAGLIPPAPVADEVAVRVLADRRLLAVLVPPNPRTYSQVTLVLAGRSHLAILMPVGE